MLATFQAQHAAGAQLDVGFVDQCGRRQSPVGTAELTVRAAAQFIVKQSEHAIAGCAIALPGCVDKFVEIFVHALTGDSRIV